MGDERTWPKTVVFQCLECGAVSNSGEAWNEFCGYPNDPDHGPLQEIEVVPASVLEERDRELAQAQQDSDGWKGAYLDTVKRATALRSQLTEARAALQELLIHIPNGTVLDRYKKRGYAVLGLVPAPQDREPTT